MDRSSSSAPSCLSRTGEALPPGYDAVLLEVEHYVGWVLVLPGLLTWPGANSVLAALPLVCFKHQGPVKPRKREELITAYTSVQRHLHRRCVPGKTWDIPRAEKCLKIVTDLPKLERHS